MYLAAWLPPSVNIQRFPRSTLFNQL